MTLFDFVVSCHKNDLFIIFYTTHTTASGGLVFFSRLMHHEKMTLTLSDLIPDVELHVFHDLVHPASEVLRLFSVDDHHH